MSDDRCAGDCGSYGIRIDHEYRPQLKLTPEKVNRLVLDAYKTPNIAELAPMIDGKPDFTKLKEIDLAGLAQRFRMQRIVTACR